MKQVVYPSVVYTFQSNDMKKWKKINLTYPKLTKICQNKKSITMNTCSIHLRSAVYLLCIHVHCTCILSRYKIRLKKMFRIKLKYLCLTVISTFNEQIIVQDFKEIYLKYGVQNSSYSPILSNHDNIGLQIFNKNLQG